MSGFSGMITEKETCRFMLAYLLKEVSSDRRQPALEQAFARAFGSL